ncbi:MAG: tatC [Anaerosporomusa subterranea]|jgi:sec-independent protein translocase protein TatC|nr:tatC [Anaerosporomusa subterranea]
MPEVDTNVTESEHIQTADPGMMSLVDHFQELRKRLMKSAIAVAVCASASYFYAAEIVALLTATAGKLYYMNPAEAFFSYLKVSLFAGFLLALPMVLYQAWAFTVPALANKERRASLFLVPASVILFFGGLGFSYYFVLPASIKFFMGYATDVLQPMFSLGQYLSFVISFLLPFGLIFELPLFILVLAKFGIISSQLLIRRRKIVLLLAFILGGIVSPTPDVMSQTMMALPLLALYEISLLIVKYIMKK